VRLSGLRMAHYVAHGTCRNDFTLQNLCTVPHNCHTKFSVGPSTCCEFLDPILDISWSSTLNAKYEDQQNSALWILVTAHYYLYVFDGLFVCELFNRTVSS
jgi:hypothetical protein